MFFYVNNQFWYVSVVEVYLTMNSFLQFRRGTIEVSTSF